MPTVSLSKNLQAEYRQLFDNCLINQSNAGVVDNLAARIESNKPRYQAAGAGTIPWYFIGVIHNMESSLNFTRHLHNGDPLTARTVQVPKGRPKSGSPPFTWEQSATDALGIKKLFSWADWTMSGILFKLEEYNGWGYRLWHPSVKSPYLWSFSNQYISGKYVKDGVWSPTARSQQCGAAVLLRRMAERQSILFDSNGDPLPDSNVTSNTTTVGSLAPLVKYRPKSYSALAEQLQTALNLFPGVFLKVDGLAGQRTSDAVKAVTGSYLDGDPRN